MKVKLNTTTVKDAKKDAVESAMQAMLAIEGFNQCLADMKELETIHSNLQLVVKTIQSCDNVTAATKLLGVGESLEGLLNISIDKASKKDVVAGCEGVIGNLFKAIGDAIKAFFKWLGKLFTADAGKPNDDLKEGEENAKKLDSDARKEITEETFTNIIRNTEVSRLSGKLNQMLQSVDKAAAKIKRLIPYLDDKSEKAADNNVFHEGFHNSDEFDVTDISDITHFFFTNTGTLSRYGWSSPAAYIGACADLDTIATHVFEAVDKKIIPYEKQLTNKVDALCAAADRDNDLFVYSNSKTAAIAIRRILQDAGRVASAAFAIKQHCKCKGILRVIELKKAAS